MLIEPSTLIVHGNFWHKSLTDPSIAWTMFGSIVTALAVIIALALPVIEKRNRQKRAEKVLDTLQHEAKRAQSVLISAVEKAITYHQGLLNKSIRTFPGYITVPADPSKPIGLTAAAYEEIKRAPSIDLSSHDRYEAYFLDMRSSIGVQMINSYALAKKLSNKMAEISTTWTIANIPPRRLLDYIYACTKLIEEMQSLMEGAAKSTRAEVLPLKGAFVRFLNPIFQDD